MSLKITNFFDETKIFEAAQVWANSPFLRHGFGIGGHRAHAGDSPAGEL